MDQKTAHHEISPYKDYTGLLSVMGQMQNQLRQLDPTYTDGAEFSFGNLHPATKTFLWMGLVWTPALLLSRGMVLALAAALALLAALFFDRFDPARAGWFATVSYTHLDVYKRQGSSSDARGGVISHQRRPLMAVQ